MSTSFSFTILFRMRILVYWAISVAILLVSILLAKSIGFDVEADMDKPLRLFLGVAVLGFVNATLGTIVKLITLPVNLISFGLVWLLLNASLFYWVGTLNMGYRVGDFWAAIACSFLMGIVLGVIRK